MIMQDSKPTVIGAAIEVLGVLGSGLLESALKDGICRVVDV